MAFLKSLYTAPAKAVTFVTALIFGGELTEGYEIPGLVGMVANGVKGVSTSFSKLIKGQETTIATALWAAIVLAAAATATVVFVPAVLAAVVGFSVAGVSIASLVGSAFVAQVAAVAILTAAATFSSVISVAAAIGVVSAIKGLFTKAAPAADQGPVAPAGDDIAGSTALITNSLTEATTNDAAVTSDATSDVTPEDKPAVNSPALFADLPATTADNDDVKEQNENEDEVLTAPSV